MELSLFFFFFFGVYSLAFICKINIIEVYSAYNKIHLRVRFNEFWIITYTTITTFKI